MEMQVRRGVVLKIITHFMLRQGNMSQTNPIIKLLGSGGAHL